MNTIITASPAEAAAILNAGGLVAFPTETVYGLGARFDSESSVRSIFEAKGRPADNPLIIHVWNTNQIGKISSGQSESALVLIEAFFPGPITLVLSKHGSVAPIVTAGLDTVGVRMPDHQLASAFLEACEAPVAAPSANQSGRPSPTSWGAVLEDLDGKIDCVLKGESSRFGLESTVVDCTGVDPVVLRPGSIGIEDLRLVVPGTSFPAGDDATMKRSPGTRHRHYQPRVPVKLVDGPIAKRANNTLAYIGIDQPEEPLVYDEIELVSEKDEYARALFSFFRRCEKLDIGAIHCQKVDEVGIGKALMDRLAKASSD